MNFNEACSNLQIVSPFTHTDLKKQYRIMALKYHPDKHVPILIIFIQTSLNVLMNHMNI